MPNAHYFYLPLTVKESEAKVHAHQENFDAYLSELFNDDEMVAFESKLDAIAAIFVQPIISELTFDDFYPDQALYEQQKKFFESCRSSVCLENLPDFHANPFQVTYLVQLLSHFHEVLIDQGGVEELVFKNSYLESLRSFKDIDSIISSPLERSSDPRTVRPVHPVDFLVLDVYRELNRLKEKKQIYEANELGQFLPEKTLNIFNIMTKELHDSGSLLKRTGLNPKDFGDNLEKLKFFLKKLP